MAEVPREQRKLKRFRRKDLNTNLLQVCRELKPRNLQALLLDAAVWLCCDEDVAHKLDTLCFGNLDGGVGTAAYVRQVLEAAGQAVQGDRAVRLSLDEAFFMAYALEIMEVHEVPQGGAAAGVSGGEAAAAVAAVALDITALWQRLQQLRHDFFLLYLAYHHFRSKGWIPRTGLQYGADFVLYQRHPALSHSDYTVIVIPLSPGQRPHLGWHDFQISNRLSTQVSKKLLLLYVQEEGGGSGDRSSPNSLARVAVHERLVRRWVPESHRPPPGGK